MQLPGITTTTICDASPIATELAFEGAPDAVLDATNVDPQNAPPWRFRAGGVVVPLAVGGGAFVEGDDPAGERNKPATVVALVPADATWGGKALEISQDGGPVFAFGLNPGDDKTAAVVATLNNHPRFQGALLADELNGLLRIRTLGAGGDRALAVNAPGIPTAFGPNGSEATGTDADYRVTLADGDLIDGTGAPAKALVACCRKGHFRVDKLRNLTAEAKVVLLRRGSILG